MRRAVAIVAVHCAAYGLAFWIIGCSIGNSIEAAKRKKQNACNGKV